MCEYCAEYVEKLKERAKDMAGDLEKITMLIRQMPNFDEEPEEAWEHFEKLVEARIAAEKTMHGFYKNEAAFSNN